MVTVVTGLWEWGQPRREIIQGIPVHRHFTAWGMFGIKGLRKFGFYTYLLSLFLYLLWHRNEYELIHCHSATSEAAIGVYAGHCLYKPALIRPMASGAFGDLIILHKDCSLGGRSWLMHNISHADAVVALNQKISDEMAALGLNKDKFHFIPNGVEIRPDRPLHDYSWHEPMRIVFMGRLHPQKGIDTLLKALGRLAQERPDLPWQLLMAGTGPLKDELQVMAYRFEIDQRVVFLGHLDRVDALLDACDCFVLPSLSEGMSNALLEAMACGLPCIATDIPGNNSLIQHQRNGLLVPPNDEQALAEAIVAVTGSEELRQSLGQEALKTVEGKYSLSRVAQQYAALYNDLVRSKAAQ